MNQLKEKKLILTEGIICVENDRARANIFKTKSGYAIPVVYGEDQEVIVRLDYQAFKSGKWLCQAYLPGIEDAVDVGWKMHDNIMRLKVPLHRGAAMVAISKQPTARQTKNGKAK